MWDYPRDIFLNISALFSHPRKNVRQAVPYFSQWESPELVDKILSHSISASQDPLWENSGAQTAEEYELWSWNICGMACLKMILTSIYKKKFYTVALATQCATYGGYLFEHRKGSDIPGLFYKPFTVFLEREFHLKSNTIKVLPIRRLKYHLSRGDYIIASVHPAIRDIKNASVAHKGGHLVVITGYDEDKKVLYLHNPSGLYKKSQENFEISETDFKRFFAGKGIVIYNAT